MEHLEQPAEPSGSDGPATELEPSHEEANGPHEPTTEDSATPLEPSDPLTPTGRVILGMIAFGKQTGYDIKQIVDRSVRHFWAASYGQIYPELRRLEEQGLITGHDEPSGGRARTVYKLTEAGERALQTWLTGPSSVEWEVRDEGMLKLFFSDLTDHGHRLENIRAMRAVQERKRDQLRELRAKAPEMSQGPRLTLELGLGSTEWLIAWCEEAERRLGDA